jgi:hypothetical protein
MDYNTPVLPKILAPPVVLELVFVFPKRPPEAEEPAVFPKRLMRRKVET